MGEAKELKEETLYKRLYISLEDFRFAAAFARHLLKKGWHYTPWERQWTLYVQQAAFTSALITSYSRPFTKSNGWPKFPLELLPYDELEMRLHKRILDLRHQVYAHSDSIQYDVHPMRIVGHPSAIVGAPFFKLTADELQSFVQMIAKTMGVVQQEIEKLMCIIERRTEPYRHGTIPCSRLERW